MKTHLVLSRSLTLCVIVFCCTLLATAQRARRDPVEQSAASRSSTAAGSLAITRQSHTATLLLSGKVLVVGGYNGSFLSGAELYDPATGMSSSTGSLTTGRASHTATLLPSGKVLVAGGNDSHASSSAELYDPATGTWSATGSLTAARHSCTATLLASGKVLVVGGTGSASTLSSAELYDPATGTWSDTGSLTAARSVHTATLLSSGKVLVAGGFGTSNYLTSAELYDPATGTWSSTGSLAAARNFHTTTLLPSGKVLVVGGYNGSNILGSAELYNPATGTWSSTASLSTARDLHTATLLPSGKVLLAGGGASSGALGSNELYNPATGTWSSTASLSAARYAHTATLLPSGKVLLAGGVGSSGYLSSVELYNSANGMWSSTANLPVASINHTATLLASGRVLLAGGTGGLATIYDVGLGMWLSTGSLNIARAGHTATLLPNGKVLVAGGIKTSPDCIDGELNCRPRVAELYDPVTGSWSNTGSLTEVQGREFHTATLLPSGKVLVAGGETWAVFPLLPFALATAELYDPATGNWTSTGSSATRRARHTATLLPSGKVLVVGGDKGRGEPDHYLSTAELYDPATGTWSSTGSLATAREGHTTTLLPSGKVLVAGGFNSTYPAVLSSAEIYDPATGTWSSTGSLATARAFHSATLLPSGLVLVAKGTDFTNELSPAELYDPATGSWSAAGNLVSVSPVSTLPTNGTYYTPQTTATLLLNGQVLIFGGSNNSAEVYNQGLGFAPNWQPLLNFVAPANLTGGSALTAYGLGFRGVSEGSGGNGPQNSSSNYPLLQLLSFVNEQTLFLPANATGWSDSSLTSTGVTMMTVNSSGFPIGYAQVTVFTNGIPSGSKVILTGAPNPAPTPTPIVLTVTKTADTNDGVCNADCSLREAIAVAAADGGTDTIVFNIPANSPGCTGTDCTIGLFSPLTPSADAGTRTTINGYTGPNTITLSGNFASRIIAVSNGVNLSLTNLTLIGGNAANGGAINVATGGMLALSNSTIRGSQASLGGAIYVASGAALDLSNVTISGNAASFGSRIGGAIYCLGAAAATNCTVTNNDAGSNVGGIKLVSGGTFNIRNTIVAGNFIDVDGNFTSRGHNLVSSPNSGNSGFTGPGDQLGVVAGLLDIAQNGGPTWTHALQSNSPAINAGSASAPPADQRGYLRNGVADIGAFEFAGVLPPPPAASGAVSRKIHSGTPFDINLPLTGNSGVECRSGGASSDYQVVFTFPSAVTFSSALVTAGTATVSNTSGSGTTTVSVDLTGVTNAQTITVTLAGVNDGTSTGDVGVTMGVLVGDTNADRTVNSGDALQTRSRSGQQTNATNFRSDVNVDGFINSGDALAVRSRSGTSLP